MFHILLLWLIAPLSIYLGLIIFNSAVFTFILFYGIVCLIVPITDLLIIQKKRLNEYLVFLGFQNFKKTFIPAFGLGVIFCVLIYAFFVYFQNYVLDLNQVKAVLYTWQIDKKYIISFMLLMIVANSVFEEIYWRGYIYKKLESKVSPTKVLVLSSLFYASYHLITTINLFSLLYGLLFTIIIFGVGFLWGLMRKKYDSIYFPVISHLLADFGIMLIYFKYFGK